MEPFDVVMLVVRAWAGIVMIAHGANHVRNLDGTAKWFASVGFRTPRLNAFASGANELAVGVALVLGLLTAPAAAGLAAIMAVAFWSIHRFAGFFVFHRPDEGYEYVVTLGLMAFAIAVLGPGSVSLDAVIGIADDLDGWVGAAIFGAGLLAAAGQLALMWRRPKREESDQ